MGWGWWWCGVVWCGVVWCRACMGGVECTGLGWAGLGWGEEERRRDWARGREREAGGGGGGRAGNGHLSSHTKGRRGNHHTPKVCPSSFLSFSASFFSAFRVSQRWMYT